MQHRWWRIVTALTGTALVATLRPRLVRPGLGRTRHRHGPEARRPPLPRGRAGLRASQRRPDRARRAAARPHVAQRRPEASGRLPRGGARRAPGLHRQPVPGPEPLGRRPGRRRRRPQRVPVRPVDDVGVPGRPGAALRRLRAPRPRRWTSVPTPPPRASPRSSAPRPRLAKEKAEIDAKHGEAEALLDRLKDEERAELLSRGSVRLPSGRARLRPRRRRRPLRDGPGRQGLRLRRRRPERVRLLRA